MYTDARTGLRFREVCRVDIRAKLRKKRARRRRERFAPQARTIDPQVSHAKFTPSAQGFRVTKKASEHQIDAKLDEIFTSTFTYSRSE
jgi:hypothetical protein